MTESNATPNPGAPAPPAVPAPAPAPAPQPPAAPQPGVSSDFDRVVRHENQQHADRAASLSTSDIHAAAKALLDDPKSAYWQSGPEHDHAVATVFRSRELQAAAEGNAPTEEMTTSQRLANRALALDQLPIPRQNMDPKVIESDNEFRVFLAYADSENISTHVVKELMSEYANHAGASGQLSEQAIEAMSNKFAGRLHPQQLALLAKWARLELNPALAKMRRR